jgi:hypothetical protein
MRSGAVLYSRAIESAAWLAVCAKCRRARLVIDGQDFRLALEQRDLRCGRAFAQRGKQSGFAVECRGRRECAQLGQTRRRYCIAGGITGMEEHFASSGMRPLVEPDRGIGAERDCAGYRFGTQAQQARPRSSGSDRPGDSGGTVNARHFRVHECAADLSADFVADHRGGDEIASANMAKLGKRQQRGQHHDAEVADAAGVHVLAHQAVAHHCISERRIGVRRSVR